MTHAYVTTWAHVHIHIYKISKTFCHFLIYSIAFIDKKKKKNKRNKQTNKNSKTKQSLFNGKDKSSPIIIFWLPYFIAPHLDSEKSPISTFFHSHIWYRWICPNGMYICFDFVFTSVCCWVLSIMIFWMSGLWFFNNKISLIGVE